MASFLLCKEEIISGGWLRMVFAFDRTNKIYREMKTLIELGLLEYDDVLRMSFENGYVELYSFLTTYGTGMFELMMDLVDWEVVEVLSDCIDVVS